VRQDGSYDPPFFWFGPRPEPPPRDIATLLRDGTIGTREAALLWASLARGRSLAVVAQASGVGKSTLLASLLSFLPATTRRLYVRGCYETFAFLDDRRVDPCQTALLVNELSPHLPVYLWGQGVTRLLDAATRGFQLMVTAHADTALDFVASLAGGPLRIPATRIAAFDTVVALEPTTRTASGRRVCGLWRLAATRDGIAIEPSPGLAPADFGEHAAREDVFWIPREELRQREALLRSLRDGELTRLPVLETLRVID
jgi:hypothetical protein